MGVSGCGKSTVGEAVAQRLGWRFQEGDALHPAANIAKMQSGLPLGDDDRAPWLARIAACIDGWRRDGAPGVVTCSALKRRYRDVLVGGHDDVRLVYLSGSPAVIAARLAARRGHFMPPGLLDSQFAALEPPAPDEHALTILVHQHIDVIVKDIVTALSPRDARVGAPA